MNTLNHIISGLEYIGESDRMAPVFNPSTGEQSAQVRLADRADVDRAVASALDAFPEWSETPILKRIGVMFRVRDLLVQNQDKLCELLVREHGKVWNDAMGEIRRGIDVVEFSCSIPSLLKGDYSSQVGPGIDCSNTREPLGVVAAITPFNFPAMVPLWTAPIAIAAGNTYILKPSEKDPSVANLICEIFSEAGLPDGVFNLVHGDKIAVDRLLGSGLIKSNI